MAAKHRQLTFGPEKLVPFTEELFDRQEEEEEKAARVLFSILEAPALLYARATGARSFS